MLDASRLAVYVVTTSSHGRSHLDLARAALAGGATAIQVRAPGLGDDESATLARDVADACRASDALSIVNDGASSARKAGADVAHVGKDANARAVRALLGDGRVLGVSVETPEQARLAAAAGADYLGVTVWATSTKPEARPVGLEGLAAVAAATALPVVGIGGIDAANAGLVLAAGAAGVAVVSAVAAAPDPVAATRELVAAVRSGVRA
ncbi:MAG: thiamine phosphate synthase [Actinomycetota bacterium]